jgi:hypothetical protein
MLQRQCTDEKIVGAAIEDLSMEIDEIEATVMDKNTNVDNETIKNWRRTVVIGPDGEEYNKHKLVKPIISPAGLELAIGAISMDQNS